jgi:hypothetical protein
MAQDCPQHYGYGGIYTVAGAFSSGATTPPHHVRISMTRAAQKLIFSKSINSLGELYAHHWLIHRLFRYLAITNDPLQYSSQHHSHYQLTSLGSLDQLHEKPNDMWNSTSTPKVNQQIHKSSITRLTLSITQSVQPITARLFPLSETTSA